jgi:hypothetical protein
MHTHRLITAMAIAAAAPAALADNVNPDVIFGSGNANGSFTIATGSNIEIGLRGKLRYNSAGLPENTFNQVGSSNTYRFDPADGNAPGNRAFWNFEWSINTDVSGSGSSGSQLNDFYYNLELFKLNADGSNPADAVSFDLINVAYADHSIGDNSTGNGAGTEAASGNIPQYQGLISSLNVAQNSWNYDFFDGVGGTALEDWNPNAAGTYLIRLTVFENNNGTMGAALLSNEINIQVVPLPTAAWAGLGLLGTLAGVRAVRRR